MRQNQAVRGDQHPVKTCHFCLQDFDTKDYTLEFYGRSITITRRQFDDGMWHEIVRSVLQVKCADADSPAARLWGQFGF